MSVGWLVGLSGNAFVRQSTGRTLLAYLALFSCGSSAAPYVTNSPSVLSHRLFHLWLIEVGKIKVQIEKKLNKRKVKEKKYNKMKVKGLV